MFKKRFLIFTTIVSICTLISFVQADSVINVSLTTAVTNIAASSTNSGNGGIIYIFNPLEKVRIYLTADGVAATTNGTLTVKIATASGSETSTNSFDNAAASNIKLIATNISANTSYTVSDWFEISGVRYLRVGQIENTHLGAVSNISLNMSYTSGSKSQ